MSEHHDPTREQILKPDSWLNSFVVFIFCYWAILAFFTWIYIWNQGFHTEKPCIAIMRTLESALEMYLMENKQVQDIPRLESLHPYLQGQRIPICPQGGSYSIKSVQKGLYIHCTTHNSTHDYNREADEKIHKRNELILKLKLTFFFLILPLLLYGIYNRMESRK